VLHVVGELEDVVVLLAFEAGVPRDIWVSGEAESETAGDRYTVRRSATGPVSAMDDKVRRAVVLLEEESLASTVSFTATESRRPLFQPITV
jgi:hypothetical protein